METRNQDLTANQADLILKFALEDISELKQQGKLRDFVFEMMVFKDDNVALASDFNTITTLSRPDLESMTLDEVTSKADELQKIFIQLATDYGLAELNDSNALVVIAAAPSTDLVSELNNIDFAKMIGGPLQAAVQAQASSSIASIDFIKEVGFEKDADGNLTGVRYVDFVYDEKTGEVDDDGNEVTISKNIKVPLLSMVQVPSLRIETVDVDFNVKLNSVQTQNVSSKLGINADVSGGWGPVKFKVSASYQRSSSSGVEVKKEYTMNVKVKATQDEIPLGLEKILNLLSN